VTCRNQGRTLDDAIRSATNQTLAPAEMLVVDANSSDLYTCQRLEQLQNARHRIVRCEDNAFGAALNAGVRLTSAAYIVLLRADEALGPTHLAHIVAVLDRDPDLGVVVSAIRGGSGSDDLWTPPAGESIEWLAAGVDHVPVAFRRSVWAALGGFDPSLPAHVEADFVVAALERNVRVVVADEAPVRCASDVLPARRPSAAYVEMWRRRHADLVEAQANSVLVSIERRIMDARERQGQLQARSATLDAELADLHRQIDETVGELRGLGSERVEFGDFRRTSPISPYWGLDRGLPLDRYYIESFLKRHRMDIGGRVLEIKDPGYTRVFGDDRVSVSDVLDIDAANPRANIVADLSCADSVEADTYDCFILTQTLGVIYDAPAALAHARRVLKPGGVLLCTLPAAGRISYEAPGLDGDYWRFTEASVRRLFSDVFGLDEFEVTGFGNVLACSAFLYGLAPHELRLEELDLFDPYFPLVYGVRAVKKARAGEKQA
jgi:SAM-dependent methyltransferase